MWAFFLANYTLLAFLALGGLIAGKIMLTILFIKNYERTVIGVVSYIFKWNSLVERDMAETSFERFIMKLQNFLSIFIYTIATVLIFVKILIK
jgi:hypothetical protein